MTTTTTRATELRAEIEGAQSRAAAAYAQGDRTTFAIQSASAHRLRKELKGLEES